MTNKEYLGMRNKNNQGLFMTIIDYKNSNDVMVVFDGYEDKPCKCIMSNFKKGKVKNWYYPEIFGVGYVGDIYKVKNSKYDFEKKLYSMWHGMLERCYSNIAQQRDRNTSYIGCVVCDEWKYYGNFRDWVISQENFELWQKA